MSEDVERTGRARRAAELALVRVCGHYGERPNFVLLGGLVPALLCSDSDRLHAGTTDVDVQVDLEIAGGAEHARRLEIALKNADFRLDSERVWRWETVQGGGYKAVIKFELLADLADQPPGRRRPLQQHRQARRGQPARYRLREQGLRAQDSGRLRPGRQDQRRGQRDWPGGIPARQDRGRLR